jgi:hypothetical protein
MIGETFTECIVEFSESANRFNICAYDLAKNQYYTIVMFKQQSIKLMKSCDNSFETLMKMLNFNRFGKLEIKHIDLLMSYERFLK